jgi:hypothetical protein
VVPLVLGLGGALLVLVLLFGACTVAMVSSPDFQRSYHRSYCSSYAERHPTEPCPLDHAR